MLISLKTDFTKDGSRNRIFRIIKAQRQILVFHLFQQRHVKKRKKDSTRIERNRDLNDTNF